MTKFLFQGYCNTIKRNIFTVHYTIDFRRIGVDNSKQCHLHSLRDLSETVAQRCSVKKGVFKNFVKFIGKHLRQSLHFNKVAGLRPATLLKNRLWHRCFPVSFAKFLRTPFFYRTPPVATSDLL